MKKIVFIILNGEEYGGSEKNVSDIINNLDREYEITLICSIGNKIVEKINKKENINLFSMKRGIISLVQIYDVLRNISPDIVHLHAARAIFMGRLVTNLVNFIERKNIQIVTTVHGLYFSPKKDNLIVRCLFGFFSSSDACTVAVSKKDGELLKNKFNYKKKIEIIYNGIDLDRFKIKVNKKKITSNLGFIGRLSQQKNPEIMIQLAQKVKKNYDILIYGEGPLAGTLRSEAKEKQLPNISFMGFSEDVVKAFSTIDILVSPSLFEGLPYTYIESLAMGVPVICTDVGGVSEVIDNSVNGILVNSDKELVSQIINGIEEIMGNYSFYSENASLKAEKFSILEMVDQYKKVYESVGEKI
ncbi:glycosyltransferase [Enterococcus sp. JM9B]|uniref:glycosyltransferase n=1 Tax=Enterococcus sp. JM9B TaxID=1857216 RepID=UPI001374F2C1|nr:glycosyltransferase [Enterococcus sp. JM9B]